MDNIIELTDWIVNNERVRGSIKGDRGLWLCGSNNEGNIFKYNPADEKPLYFNPKTRIIQITNGSKYLIKKNTVCKAIGLDRESEKILMTLKEC